MAEVFATGAIDFRMMAALVNRNENVTDPDLLASAKVKSMRTFGYHGPGDRHHGALQTGTRP